MDMIILIVGIKSIIVIVKGIENQVLVIFVVYHMQNRQIILQQNAQGPQPSGLLGPQGKS